MASSHMFERRAEGISHRDHRDGALELYEIPQDMGEKNNLAAQQPDKVKVLHEKLIVWRKEVGALMPTPNTAPVKAK